MKIVIDSSVIIDFTRAGLGVLEFLVELKKVGKIEILLLTIVVAELWAGREVARGDLEKLLSGFVQVELTEKIAKKTGEILRDKSASGFDSIIAATALECGAQLATRNIKHFAGVKGIKIFESEKS